MNRLLIATLLFCLILLAACGKSGDVEQDEPVKNDQVSESTDEKAPDTDDELTDETDSDSSTDAAEIEDGATNDSVEQNNDKLEAEIITKGSYNGQVDPHTIEVETDEGPLAYQLTMEARDMVVDLNPGDQVTYSYYRDGEMLVIKHIEIAN